MITSLINSQFNDISNNIPDDINIDSFKMPITYLDNNCLFKIDTHVSDDLELYNDSSNNIYSNIFKPKNDFSINNIKYWNNYYTNNIHFLKDTQHIIKNFNIFDEVQDDYSNILLDVWDETKNQQGFYTKYNYLDWNILKPFNNYSSILLLLTLFNISTPILFFLTPLFILIIPFFILKYQGIPITFSIYFNIMKDLLKNQFFGGLLKQNNYSGQFAIFYFIACAIFFIIQAYSNFKTCIDLYNNIKHVNTYICDLKKYFINSRNNMKKFKSISIHCDTYIPFINDLNKHENEILLFIKEIDIISPFNHSPKKVLEFGELLKIYYFIHANKNLEKAIQFSFGFEGYIYNLKRIHSLSIDNHISFAQFSTLKKDSCSIKKQVYPPIYDSNDAIFNDFNLSKNAIITGPNASGKTTTLKTTIINVILTQQLGIGFYKQCKINPYSHIHSYINIPDTSNRDSLFQAESRRCKDIIDRIVENNDKRHLCIFDELYSGTNPDEAPKAGYSFLKYLNKFSNVDLILTTHYSFICKKFKKSKKITNYQMKVDTIGDDHNFTYNIIPGISEHKGAIKVLRDMNYPTEIINTFTNLK